MSEEFIEKHASRVDWTNISRYQRLSDAFIQAHKDQETYETFADCSDDQYSFGFSASTMEDAEKYCRELVIPCRIEYKDVARVIYGDGGKIRCRKLTVLG